MWVFSKQISLTLRFCTKSYFVHGGVVILNKMPYYAVAKGRSVGIYNSWAECEAQVKGFSGARYKKFDSPQTAQDFVTNEGGSSAMPKNNYHSKQSYYSQPKQSTNNLKRSYPAPSASKSHVRNYSSNSRYDTSFNSSYDSSETDDSDAEKAAMVNKQLDNLEKRMKTFSKGVDKIMQKGLKIAPRQSILIEAPQPKRRRSNNNTFDTDPDGYVQVYTDGACSSNGRQGARAGLGVYWGDNHSLNTSEPVSGRATNNCGEIQAATKAMQQALDNGVTKLAINTDSKFLIKSAKDWMPGWKQRGWKLASGEPVKNEKDFRELDKLQKKLDVKWNYVEAHKGVHGNEMADQLAKNGASKYQK